MRIRGLLELWRRRRPDAHEHPLVRASSQWIDKRPVAFVLAYGAVLVGVWAEFDNELGIALGRAIHNLIKVVTEGTLTPLGDRVHVRTGVFLVLLLVIATLLWKRLKADDQRQDERTLGTLRALYRVPNISVVRTYAEGYWPAFVNALQETWPDEAVPPEEQRPAMARAIRDALAVIIQMAHEFARGGAAQYGANIMLIIGRNDAAPMPFPKSFVEKLRFHSHGALDELWGLLYLPDELVVENLEDVKERRIARIVLPVPYTEPDDSHMLVLPGAPMAVLRGGQVVQEDTRRISEECADFSAPVRDELGTYFSEKGDGRDVLSFASFRLGTYESPIGVLNIDSDRTHVLGLEDEFHDSFHALIRPMTDRLSSAVVEYAALWEPQIAQLSAEPSEGAELDSPASASLPGESQSDAGADVAELGNTS